MKIHLELLVFAVLAGGLTSSILVSFNASVTLSIVSSLMAFTIALFLLERRYGHDIHAFLQLFAKIPLVWSLTLCAGVYSYCFAMILQLPSWAMILVVGFVTALCWRLVKRNFR
jgi:hypothetical protein